MTNKEIEKMFNRRFIISLTTFDKNTFAPSFNFFDKKDQKAYSVPFDVTGYDDFKIRYLREIVENLIEVRDEKINILLDES